MLSAAPTVRLQVRIGDSRLKDTESHGFSEPAPCPLKGHNWLTDITTPFPGNASASFQQNLNRLPTGGDRIPGLSAARQGPHCAELDLVGGASPVLLNRQNP